MGTYMRPGQGPTVVFIAQLGTGGDSWAPVIDLLPDQAVFTYDRPATGDSPGRPAPNPPLPHSGFASELADLLDQHTGIDSPVVLVGHSFGNLIARAFADLFPGRVAGMVHVDGSIPPFHLHPSAEPKLDGDGPDATEIDVVRGHVEILSAALPEVPALVLTRTPGAWNGDEQPLPHPAVEDLWLASQRLLARNANAPLLVCDDCGHQIPEKQPQLVAYAVQEVVAAVREGRRLWPDRGRLEALGAHVDDAIGSGLPPGSIVETRDSVAYRDDQDDNFPWAETAGLRSSDSYIRELLAGGFARLLRHGFDGAPPEPPSTEE